jgi:hypothetical protein
LGGGVAVIAAIVGALISTSGGSNDHGPPSATAGSSTKLPISPTLPTATPSSIGADFSYLADWEIQLPGMMMTGPAQINGEEYLHGLIGGQAQYVLRGHGCDQLSYTAGVVDSSPQDAQVQFNVFGDDRRLKSFQLGKDQPARQTVDIRGVDTLRLASYNLKQQEYNVVAA